MHLRACVRACAFSSCLDQPLTDHVYLEDNLFLNVMFKFIKSFIACFYFTLYMWRLLHLLLNVMQGIHLGVHLAYCGLGDDATI